MTDDKHMPVTLDHNGQIGVEIQSRPGGAVTITIDLARVRSHHLLAAEGHLRSGGLRLRVDDTIVTPALAYEAGHKQLRLALTTPVSSRQMALMLYGQPLLHWRRSNGQWHADASKHHHRLLVSELRILGTSEICPPNLPADRALFNGFDAAQHAPITDLHTHSSAQITAHEFMELGLKHEIDYPVELLDKLGVILTNEERAHLRDNGTGLTFDPTKAEGLACEQGGGATYPVVPLSQLSKAHRDCIEAKLHVPQDAVLCFSDFDREMYRYLNPFSKNAALTKDIIYQIGESYAAQGIRYAELSTGAMLLADKSGRAEWFREMVAAVEEVEKNKNVRLRFLVGIPRDKAPHEVLAALEKIKYAARHPTIAGVDILGYENSKAKQLSWALEHIADWARAFEGSDLNPDHGWDFKRDFVVRTHAGETAKNDGNVAESVRIAERTGVNLRVAHAVHEQEDATLDKRVATLAAKNPDAIGFEFCPLSNIAYNNILTLDGVPFARWVSICPNWFLGSDGGGAVQSTSAQLALSALAGGLALADLQHLRRNEERYIAREAERNALKNAAFMRHYGADIDAANDAFFAKFEAHLAYVNALTDTRLLDATQPQLPKEYDHKVPILIAGAGGDSWKRLNEATQQTAAKAMQMLVATLDPAQAYFVCGRTKDEGITKMLDEAIRTHNEAHPQNRFLLLALNTAETSDVAHSIHWMVPQGGDTSKVSANITAFMANHPMRGVSVFIGGSNFTQDMIAQTMRTDRAKFLLMENAEGASKAFATKVKDERKFSDAETLVRRMADTLRALYPTRSIFRK